MPPQVKSDVNILCSFFRFSLTFRLNLGLGPVWSTWVIIMCRTLSLSLINTHRHVFWDIGGRFIYPQCFNDRSLGSSTPLSRSLKPYPTQVCSILHKLSRDFHQWNGKEGERFWLSDPVLSILWYFRSRYPMMLWSGRQGMSTRESKLTVTRLLQNTLWAQPGAQHNDHLPPPLGFSDQHLVPVIGWPTLN